MEFCTDLLAKITARCHGVSKLFPARLDDWVKMRAMLRMAIRRIYLIEHFQDEPTSCFCSVIVQLLSQKIPP